LLRHVQEHLQFPLSREGSMIKVTKDGRTIRTDKDYTDWRREMWGQQAGACQSCGRPTNLSVSFEYTNSFHCHHIYGRGGGKRDDVRFRNEKQICRGDCGECHRREHGQ